MLAAVTAEGVPSWHRGGRSLQRMRKLVPFLAAVVALVAGLLYFARQSPPARSNSSSILPATLQPDSFNQGTPLRASEGTRESVQTPPGQDTEEVKIGVYSRAGSPLSGVRVRWEDTPSKVVETDGGGWCRLAPNLTGEVDFVGLHATKQGFLEKRVLVPRTARDVRIQLDEPASIRGRVTLPDGNPPDRPITVVGWSAKLTRVPPEGSYETLLRSGKPSTTGPILISKVEPDGSFTLEGADPSTHWLVTAGGMGLLCPVEEVGRPGEREVELVCHFVYLSLLEFRNEQGETPNLPESSASSRRLSFWCDEPDAEICLFSRMGELLSGFHDGPRSASPFQKVLAFTAPFEAESVGPCHVQATFPGIPRVDVEFRASSLAFGPTLVRVSLPEASFPGGSISLDPGGASAEVIRIGARLRKLRPSLLESSLQLKDESGRAETYGFLLDLEHSTRIDGIPTGRYRVQVETMGQHARFPESGTDPQWVEIVSGQVAHVPLDFSRFGALHVSLLDSDGYDLTGWARFAVGEGEPRESNGRTVMNGGMQTFVEGPYTVGILPAGTYTLQGFDPPFGHPADAKGYVPVTVTAGVETHLRIQASQ